MGQARARRVLHGGVKRMAVWSIVNHADAWREQRFDPEFWQPS
jgi:hypothetical protein